MYEHEAGNAERRSSGTCSCHNPKHYCILMDFPAFAGCKELPHFTKRGHRSSDGFRNAA